jgi:hypothetical protein
MLIEFVCSSGVSIVSRSSSLRASSASASMLVPFVMYTGCDDGVRGDTTV